MRKNIVLDQEIAFSNLLKAIKKEEKGLIPLLKEEDQNSDGVLTTFEVTNFLQKLLKNPIRVYSIMNFFELNNKYDDI